MEFTLVVPQGLEDVGAQELAAFGASNICIHRNTLSFTSDLACFYRIHLLARIPFRIFRQISKFDCCNPQSLYINIQNSFQWELLLSPSMTFRVDISGKHNNLPHSHFTALQVKNAIVDYQRNLWNKRSNIDIQNPDICLHLHLNNYLCTLSLSGSNSSLHRRGYKSAMGIAPLKENLASGLIKLTGWEGEVPLIDPFCGSGTFLLEAVASNLGIASGLNRNFSFQNWHDFDVNIWNREKEKAKKFQKLNKKLPPIIGCERNIDVFNQARINIDSADLTKHIDLRNIDYKDIILPNQEGIIVCNPPYGNRVGNVSDLPNLYSDLGNFLKKRASGWDLWLLSGNSELTAYLGMKSSRKFPVTNGSIDCRWMHYKIH